MGSGEVKKSDGTIDSFVLGNRELLGGGGDLYFEANTRAGYWRLPTDD